jgi:hypothetical protein
MQHQPTNWITTLIPFVIIAGVLAFRIRTMSRERPLNLATLWIIPAVYVLVAGSLVFAAPPSQLGWGLMAVGLAIGLGLGWYRGRLIHIHRDAETGKLRQKASPVAMILLVGLIAIKLGAKAIFGETTMAHPSSGAMLLTDAFIGFVLGLLSATRAELYLRGRRLLEA